MATITLLFCLFVSVFANDFGSLDALNCLLPTPHLSFSLPNVLVNHCNVRVKAQYSCDRRQNTNIGSAVLGAWDGYTSSNIYFPFNCTDEPIVLAAQFVEKPSEDFFNIGACVDSFNSLSRDLLISNKCNQQISVQVLCFQDQFTYGYQVIILDPWFGQNNKNTMFFPNSQCKYGAVAGAAWPKWRGEEIELTVNNNAFEHVTLTSCLGYVKKETIYIWNTCDTPMEVEYLCLFPDWTIEKLISKVPNWDGKTSNNIISTECKGSSYAIIVSALPLGMNPDNVINYANCVNGTSLSPTYISNACDFAVDVQVWDNIFTLEPWNGQDSNYNNIKVLPSGYFPMGVLPSKNTNYHLIERSRSYLAPKKMEASNPHPVSFNSNCFTATWLQLGKNGAYLSNSCNQSAFVQFACYSDNGLFISNASIPEWDQETTNNFVLLPKDLWDCGLIEVTGALGVNGTSWETLQYCIGGLYYNTEYFIYNTCDISLKLEFISWENNVPNYTEITLPSWDGKSINNIYVGALGITPYPFSFAAVRT